MRSQELIRIRLSVTADGLAIALAVSLPWSTSATSILAALWLVALVPTLQREELRRVLSMPAGWLPVLLWALGFFGMFWANDVAPVERLGGLSSFHKLLAIPLLMVQFQRSDKAIWVMVGFIASCGILFVVSWYLILAPGLTWRGNATTGVPVKDYIAQSVEFIVCSFLLLGLADLLWRKGRRVEPLLLLLAALAFFSNVYHISLSRTALVLIPTLLVVFAFVRLSRRGALATMAFAVLACVATWMVVPTVRENVNAVLAEVMNFDRTGERTRAGERLEYWLKSVEFVAEAPVIGHGTGTIREKFRRASESQTGMAGLVSANPHNQVLAVAIQLGLIGTIVLIGMWGAHGMLFRGASQAHWAGLLIVTQNIVGSLFNSHLFDFAHGWGYVIGVGVAAGMVLRAVQAGERRASN